MSGKRNVSVCRGHELANALYAPWYGILTYMCSSVWTVLQREHRYNHAQDKHLPIRGNLHLIRQPRPFLNLPRGTSFNRLNRPGHCGTPSTLIRRVKTPTACSMRLTFVQSTIGITCKWISLTRRWQKKPLLKLGAKWYLSSSVHHTRPLHICISLQPRSLTWTVNNIYTQGESTLATQPY